MLPGNVVFVCCLGLHFTELSRVTPNTDIVSPNTDVFSGVLQYMYKLFLCHFTVDSIVSDLCFDTWSCKNVQRDVLLECIYKIYQQPDDQKNKKMGKVSS